MKRLFLMISPHELIDMFKQQKKQFPDRVIINGRDFFADATIIGQATLVPKWHNNKKYVVPAVFSMKVVQVTPESKQRVTKMVSDKLTEMIIAILNNGKYHPEIWFEDED